MRAETYRDAMRHIWDEGQNIIARARQCVVQAYNRTYSRTNLESSDPTRVVCNQHREHQTREAGERVGSVSPQGGEGGTHGRKEEERCRRGVGWHIVARGRGRGKRGTGTGTHEPTWCAAWHASVEGLLPALHPGVGTNAVAPPRCHCHHV